MVKNWFLHGPNQVVKKLSNGGFWPSQMMTPKSGEKVVKKWSNGGPSNIWGHKNGKNMPLNGVLVVPGPGRGRALARPGPGPRARPRPGPGPGQRPGPSGRSPVVKHTDLPPRGVGGRAPDRQKGQMLDETGRERSVRDFLAGKRNPGKSRGHPDGFRGLKAAWGGRRPTAGWEGGDKELVQAD